MILEKVVNMYSSKEDRDYRSALKNQFILHFASENTMYKLKFKKKAVNQLIKAINKDSKANFETLRATTLGYVVPAQDDSNKGPN